MKITKKISSDLSLIFHYDPTSSDEQCFVLKDELYEDEVILTSKEMETLVDSVMEMKKDTNP